MNSMITIPKQNRSYSNTDRHAIINENLCSAFFTAYMCKVCVSCFNYGNLQYVIFIIADQDLLIIFHSVFSSGATLFCEIYIFPYIRNSVRKCVFLGWYKRLRFQMPLSLCIFNFLCCYQR